MNEGCWKGFRHDFMARAPTSSLMLRSCRNSLLLLALLAVLTLVPGPVLGEAASREIPIEYSFNESHTLIYQQMLEQNASIGEYYEQVCPEFLEGMPPEVRAHVYNTTMLRHEPPGGDRVLVPPLVTGKVAVARAPSVISVCGVHIGLIGAGILGLLAVAWLILQRVRNRKE